MDWKALFYKNPKQPDSGSRVAPEGRGPHGHVRRDPPLTTLLTCSEVLFIFSLAYFILPFLFSLLGLFYLFSLHYHLQHNFCFLSKKKKDIEKERKYQPFFTSIAFIAAWNCFLFFRAWRLLFCRVARQSIISNNS